MTAVAGYDVGVKQQTPFFYNILFFFYRSPQFKNVYAFFLAGQQRAGLQWTTSEPGRE